LQAALAKFSPHQEWNYRIFILLLSLRNALLNLSRSW
jgi:hypothetical protein